jgi:hypothetical protein
MRDPLGVDSRASKRVPGAKVPAALEEATRTSVAIDTSRVAKSLSMQRKFCGLCATASLHGTLDEPAYFTLHKTTKLIFS